MIVFCTALSLHAGPIGEWVKQHKSQKEKSKQLLDVEYGKHFKQKLDVFLPDSPKNAPIIIMVHGGAWKMGDKARFKSVDNKVSRWCPKGYIVISLNYRLLPKADPMMQASDVANAMIYVQAHAKEWGGDEQKILLMGHSSGGHLVSLISSNPNRYAGLKPWLGTVSLDSAAMDVVALMNEKRNRFYDDAFGEDTSYWVSVSPYHQLTNTAKPMLLVCGTQRANEPCKAAESFSQKAKELGVRTEIVPLKLDHGAINEELGKENDYTKRVEVFMKSLGI